MDGNILAGLLVNVFFWTVCLALAAGFGMWFVLGLPSRSGRRGGRKLRGAARRGEPAPPAEGGGGGSEGQKKAA